MSLGRKGNRNFNWLGPANRGLESSFVKVISFNVARGNNFWVFFFFEKFLLFFWKNKGKCFCTDDEKYFSE